ncbi:MAG: hypothetical protein LKI42_02765 [Bacteroidales bacterium]|jgi:hypothetical protein|nr:hypothetical protein [Bacteroidales bacterium]MCI1784850.1 hypothetical protein [Bacteroidales bacterium]
MKKIAIAILTFGIFLTGNDLSAQGRYGADSAECIKYLSYYKEYYKQKDFKDALPSWRKAYKLCPPTASQNMLLDGSSMMRDLIFKNSGNPDYRKALIDTLLTLSDIRAQYYPKFATRALNNKGLDMANYMKDDSKALYDGLNDIIDKNKEKTISSLYLFNLNAAIDLYQKGQLKAEDVINIYQRAVSSIDKIPASNSSAAAQNDKVKTDLENLFISSKVASCDNLISLYTPRYEEDSTNLETISGIVKIMSNVEGCTDNALYMKAVTSLYKLDPSYKSAYYLYSLNASKDNVNTAVEYLEDAINFKESDDKTDAQYEYELAKYLFKNGSSVKAYEEARKAVALDPSIEGKADFLMGTIWGSTVCGGNEIEKRAQYWVAVDYLVKAKKADPTLSDDANELIKQYSTYFPQTAEAFMYDITNGQSYTVSCGGLRATTIVRTQK